MAGSRGVEFRPRPNFPYGSMHAFIFCVRWLGGNFRWGFFFAGGGFYLDTVVKGRPSPSRHPSPAYRPKRRFRAYPSAAQGKFRKALLGLGVP